MNSITKRLLALLLVLAMACVALAGCGAPADDTADDAAADDAAADDANTADDSAEDDAAADDDAAAKNDTLVVGYSNFSAKFSPFFASSAYDQDVQAMTQLGLLGSDREGNIIMNGIEGETRPYNGVDYFYDGIANCVITENEDGTVTYDFVMREDIVFSDGTPMTIDDVIFSMYVLSDPAYDGSSTFYALPIEGMEEYRAGMASKMSLILADLAAGNDTAAATAYTADDVAAFEAALAVAGENFAQEIVDYCQGYLSYAEAWLGGITADEVTAEPGLQVALGMAGWGYGAVADGVLTAPSGATFDLANGVYPTAADYWNEIFTAYGYDFSAETGVNYETAGTPIETFIGDADPSLAASVVVGDTAPSITGIVKTGDYSMTIKLTRVDATAIYQLGVAIAPLHYYGEVDLYDYENNMFGFVKGDLSDVKSVTTHPVGAGAYKFVEYKDGIVYFEANENYYKGCPKIPYIRFQEVADADKLTGVASGTFDVSDPSFSVAAAAAISEYNGGAGIVGDVVTTNLVDNLGYGYIGIQANNVSVGGEAGSDASKNLRKAFATLFSVYRDTVIASYYGEAAAVIQYPISNTSWAAPRPADEGYQLAYSVDAEGNAIYTADMTDEDKYAAALEAAKGFLIAAGYTFDEAAGVFTAAPEGASLSYEIQIPADGVGDHPVYDVCISAQTALATIGITLNVTDLANSSVLWDNIDAGTIEMWAAAWGSTVDPDMYQIYYGANAVGNPDGTGSNYYCIQDAELDSLILEARTSLDQAFRKATYKTCLDLILDWAVEVPTYQRQNCILFRTSTVNMETVTPDITTFWGWMNDIELLELN